MEHIQPGLLHWTAYRDTIGADVHSYFYVPSRTLIDPMVPPEGMDALGAEPERIVLTNRHHYRDSARFGCPVLCHESGLHEFADGAVEGFAFGDELADGVRALEVGVLTPEETAVHLATDGGALAFADCVVRGRHGELGFVSDYLLGDDPPAIRDGLRAAFRRLCDETDFDALLLAHGEPIAHGGRTALRTFADAPTAGAPPG
jgi:hypothetical protein